MRFTKPCHGLPHCSNTCVQIFSNAWRESYSLSCRIAAAILLHILWRRITRPYENKFLWVESSLLTMIGFILWWHVFFWPSVRRWRWTGTRSWRIKASKNNSSARYRRGKVASGPPLSLGCKVDGDGIEASRFEFRWSRHIGWLWDETC